MKYNNRIGFCAVLLGIFAFLSFIPIQSEAEESTSFSFNNGEKQIQLTDTKKVKVNNDTVSTISIMENGKEIYNKELTLIKISSIEKLTINSQEYALVNYRYSGSSNALFFQVLKMNDKGLEKIFESEVFERARIDVVENDIEIKYPEYDKEDVKTNPSKLITQLYTIKNSGFNIGDRHVKELDNINTSDSNKLSKGFSTFSTDNTTYTNPSNAEINKMLTEEAIDAGISPEIVKAIAYQESGWQQYWNDVPDSIKKCPNYDGTNVKLGYDCNGIGIMQISNNGHRSEEDLNNLKTDIRYNIQVGIEILKDKWNYHNYDLIPTINNNDPMVIENWYFAIMAYNGLLPRNNPLEKPFPPYAAYQEEVLQRIGDLSLVNINPFPTHKLDPYEENGLLKFRTSNFIVEGPQHYSSQSLTSGDTSYVTTNNLNLRQTPGGNEIDELNKGTQVTITGPYVGTNSKVNQFVWFPIKTSTGKTGYVASSYLSPSDEYIDKYSLRGERRYETGVSITNHGWHWEQPTSVVIGRGDVPIDALTGSVLASSLDSPLLLTQSHRLTESVEQELNRIQPSKVYILGGDNSAILPSVEEKLKDKFGDNNVIRLAGTDRYSTAFEVAEQVSKLNGSSDEIFVTTGDEKSSDALAIAPYAGANKIPILLTKTNGLNQNIINYIKDYGIKKVTLIGGPGVISSSVKKHLEKLVGEVYRVSGDSRFKTNAAIIDEFYEKESIDKLFVTQGYELADALSVSPLAAKYNEPIILTRTEKIPAETENWMNKSIKSKPDLYFLGGPNAVSNTVRSHFVNLVR